MSQPGGERRVLGPTFRVALGAPRAFSPKDVVFLPLFRSTSQLGQFSRCAIGKDVVLLIVLLAVIAEKDALINDFFLNF